MRERKHVAPVALEGDLETAGLPQRRSSWVGGVEERELRRPNVWLYSTVNRATLRKRYL